MRRYVLKGSRGAAAPSLSIADNSTVPAKINSYRARSKAALAWNVQREAERNPSGAGFLTLTVGDWKDGRWVGIDDLAEIGRRWNSLRRHLVKWLKIGNMVAIPERHQSGNWHLHVFASTSVDIRRQYQRGKRASKGLQAQWATLRRKLPGFGFGRHQWEPVLSVGACGRYLGKYLGKGMEGQQPDGKRMRLVRYCGEWACRMQAKGWSWATKGGDVHRRVLRAFGAAWGVTGAEDWQGRLRAILGPKWCAIIWGWWTKAKNRGWTVMVAARVAENEGLFPPGASHRAFTMGCLATAYKTAEIPLGKMRGISDYRGPWAEPMLEW